MKKLFMFASAAVLLAGCSQDLTEDLGVEAPSFSGKSKVVVTVDNGDATRTHLENGTPMWDEGDALGVFSYKEEAAVTDDANAVFKFEEQTEETAKFGGEFKMLANNQYIAYYPYTVDQVLNEGRIKLAIPARQNFVHVDAHGLKQGTYAQNAMPMVGTGEAQEDNVLTVKLTSVATALYFPIKGSGTITKLELTIEGCKLNGTSSNGVDVTADAPALSLGGASSDTSKNVITLNCGAGVPLSEVSTNFWFVVPVLNVTEAKTLTLKVNGSIEMTKQFKGTTKPNGVNRVLNADGDEWRVDIEDDGSTFIVDNEYKFLEYAYAASVAESEMGEGVTIPEAMKSGDALKTAKVIANLDFSPEKFTATASANATPYRKAVVEWYNTNNAIPTIGGQKAFSIVGALVAGGETRADEADGEVEEDEEEPATPAEPATIKGLTVNGCVFNDGYVSSTNKSDNKVENITLTNVTVKSNNSYFLTKRLFPTDGGIEFKGVTVGEGCVVEGAENATLVGRAFTSENYTNETVANEAGLTFANELNIYNKKVKFAAEAEAAEASDVQTVGITYNILVIHSRYVGAILYVDGKDAAAEVMGKVKEGNTIWYSVMDSTTSYWTGTVADEVNDDKILTAEELAYYVKNGSSETVTLTNNINLMGDTENAPAWTVAATPQTVNFEGEGNTISNVTVDGAYLLANSGWAKNVTVEDATYTATTGYVGGLFYEAAADVAAETEGCDVQAEAAAEKFGTYYGKVNVTLGKGARIELTADIVSEQAPYGAIVCSAEDTISDKYTNIYFEDKSYSKDELEAIAKRIEWSGVNIPNEYYLQLISFNVTVPWEYTGLAENITDDATLAAVIESVKDTEEPVEIKVKAGSYGKLPAITNENITLVCEEGTVFDGANKGDIGGATVVGATFTNSNPSQATEGVLSGDINGKFVDCEFAGDKNSNGLYYTNVKADAKVVFEHCYFTGATWAAHIEGEAASVEFTDCTFDGFVALGLKPNYTFTECRFYINEESTYGGGNFRGNCTFTKCEFALGDYTNDTTFQWIDFSNENNDTSKTHVFTQCTVKGEPLTDSYKFRVSTVMTNGINITIDGHTYHFAPNSVKE